MRETAAEEVTCDPQTIASYVISEVLQCHSHFITESRGWLWLGSHRLQSLG